MDRLRWGILGTGNIAHQFAEGVVASKTGTLVAVGSRSEQSAEAFANEFAGIHSRGSYDALLADPDVDAVYISLPNHLHGQWTARAAMAGKHILCEKPFTVNHAEAVHVLDTVKQQGVFFMEAFMYRCHPQTVRLRALLDEGVVGDIRCIHCGFSYNMELDYTNIRLSNPAAGGGIMDVGCYPMSMVRFITGKEPVSVDGAAHIGSVSRVDEVATASLLFPGGTVAALTCGIRVNINNELVIYGSKGSIRVPDPWKPGATGSLIFVDAGDRQEEIVVDAGAPIYAIEADTVAAFIEQKQTPAMPWADTLSNMSALDAWRRSVGLVFDVEA